MGCGCGKKTPVIGGRKTRVSKSATKRPGNGKKKERVTKLKALVKASRRRKKRKS